MGTALIIDTLSIQTYIFGSNKLKENIGASYIIEELVYKQMIPKALEAAGISTSMNICEWKDSNNDLYKLKDNPNKAVEVGYVGGGNAFLIFKDIQDVRSFIHHYSKLLLEFFPGLKSAYAFEKFDYQEGDDYAKFRKTLNEKLIDNRNFSMAQVIPQKHGIVEDCPWTNEAQEAIDRQTGGYVSMMAISKLSLVDDAQVWLDGKFKDEIGDDFTFTVDLEKFGQPDDKGYIAIVHADGNGMGKRFIECNSLSETRKLSAGVADYADIVIKELIGYITTILFKGDNPKLNWPLKEENGKRVLPIRPLIIGGDDITFVCEGRLGVHLAEKLLEYMSKTAINGDTIHACAGVAIVHTKYPFYKAYQLAEELTKRAKDASRGNVGGSWLEYMISTGGFSGTLKDIIADQFTVSGKGVLKYGPYRVDDGSTMKILTEGIKYFIKGTAFNKGFDKWPRNKIKDLRDALQRDDAYQSYFLTEMDARGLSLPDGAKSLWQGKKTPYYDMIELIDFYPEQLLP